MSESYLTPADAAKLLGVSPLRVRQLADAGQLPVVRTESGWRLFTRSDVERLVAEREERRHARGAA